MSSNEGCTSSALLGGKCIYSDKLCPVKVADSYAHEWPIYPPN